MQRTALSPGARVLDIVRRRPDVVALLAIAITVLLLPKRTPGGIFGLGAEEGAGLALQAMGVVLIYQSNRIINFAQVALGGAAGSLFFVLVVDQPMVRALRSGCGSCADGHVVQAINFYLSIAICLGLAALLSWLVYILIVRRFDSAPRLILTVATIGLASAVGIIQDRLPRLLVKGTERRSHLQEAAGRGTGFRVKASLDIYPVHFDSADILKVVVALLALVGIYLFFRRGRSGIALRGSAENPTRAGSLGVNVTSVTSLVWVLAGLLSAAVSMLNIMSAGTDSGGFFSAGVLVRILAIVVCARLVSLPITVLVAVGVGVLDQAVFFSYADQVLGDLVLFGIIAGVLLIQRNRSMSRAELEQASAWRADREVRPIPDELRRLPVVRSWTRNGKVLLAVLALGYPWITSTTQTATAERSIILAMVGLSILVLSGWAGQISLGQFAIAAVGGWVTVVLVGHAGFPFYFALPVAALAGGALALLIGLPALRLRGLYLAVSTLAFAVAGTSLVFSRRFLGRFLPDVINRPHLLGLDLDDVRSRYYFSLLMLTLCAVAVVGLRRSRFARVLIAARDNEQNAEAFGISVTRSRLTAFAVSGIIAALAGGVLALGQQGLDARSFSAEASIGVFLTASLGGLGAISGPMLGAVFFLAVRLLATDPVLGEFITSTGLLAVLLLLPGGLSAGFYRLRDSLLRRVAIRNRILSPALFSDNRLEAIQNPKAAIAPNTRAGGVAAFVPPRYRLDELGTKGERARPPVAAARSDS